MSGRGGSETPAVSFIVPAYNTAQYIGAALDSALAQTYTDHEIIVINDGSPDQPELERVLAKYGDRIRYLTQPNQGLAAARNTGIRAARGRYIALLDSDDILEADYLAVQVEALERDPSLDVVYPNALLFGDSPDAGRTYMDVCPSEGELTVESLLTHQCNVFVGVLARREALFRVGLFDPALRSSEDFDLWLRLLATGGRMGYHRQVVVRCRKRPGSLSADPVWMSRHALQVLEKAARTLPFTGPQRSTLEERRRYFHARLHLEQGKREVLQGRPVPAVAHLREANAYFRTLKLTLAIRMLRLAPQALRRLYGWRDRLGMRAGRARLRPAPTDGR
jgi:glycosyltransferase involved in cell wall biosynthesis